MNNYPYRINVGFLINAPVGTFRDFTIDQPSMELADDMHAEEIHCSVRVSKVQQGILAEANCSAQIGLECTRCLEPFTGTLNTHFEELFYFHYLRENQDAELFLPESGYMDLGDLIREYLVMEVPYAPVCKESCKGLCPICGKNLNLEPHEHTEDE
ncbi:MAG: DUF177 domain-containing protein [Anaerolineaceae bacterium]|nr:DUF177 domain-containing protein [Anaerolineaceae bacterium]